LEEINRGLLTAFIFWRLRIDRLLPAGIRCTVQIDPKDYGRPGKKLTGKVVSPSTPREENGTYWGFTTRIANSIHKVFEECPFEGGYDMKIGTSERGDVSVEDRDFRVPKFKHSLIVFGGVAGIEECVDADETSKLPGSESKKLFELWYVRKVGS
jgi:methyltransferase